MTDKALNEVELRKKLFAPSTNFSSKYITLPNIMVMRWVSFGYSFQQEFPLNTDEEYDTYVHWWLLNQQCTESYKAEILDYFTKNYHYLNISDQDDVLHVTPLMKLIWRRRKDLQELFPDICNDDRLNYWQWWCRDGWKECGLLTPVLFNFSGDKVTPERLLGIIKEFFWEGSIALQKEYPDPLGSDRKNFSGWLSKHKEEHGFFDSETEGCFNGLSSQKKTEDLQLENQCKVSENRESKGKVALIGHPTGMFGLGEDVRLIAEALEVVGVEVDLFIANSDISANKFSYEKALDLSDYQGVYEANIFCMPAFDMLNVIFDHKLNIFTSTINIGIWQWELSDFPQEAKFAFELVHHVWSISQFASDSIEGALKRKVDVLPLPVLTPVFEKKTRLDFQLPENDFLYFFSYDGGSFVNRKNPLGVIEAFQRAFPSEPGVCCVIKTIKYAPNDILHECQRRAESDSRIYIIDKVLSRSDFLALLNVSDVVVSLHRAEGFGRLMAEAFLMEKPVISSGYSGNLEYMTDENSYLIGGVIVPLFEQDYLFAKGKRWFEPDINQAAETMRHVFFNRDEAIDRAKKGRAEIENNFSIQRTGEVLLSLLQQDKKYLSAIRFFIEKPVENFGCFSKDFELAGWVISDNPIKDIKVYINGALYLQVAPDIQREDVLSFFPDYPKNQKPGFSENIEIKALKTGLNEITIKMSDQNHGSGYASIIVERSTKGMDYHYYYIAARNHAHEIIKENNAGDKTPKMSLYVVCDSLEGLEDTLNSILNQSYKNIEIKIVAHNNFKHVERYLLNSKFNEIHIMEEINVLDSDLNEYVGFIVPGEIMDYASVEQWACDIYREKPDLSYADNDCYLPSGLHCDPNFKPDWSYNYLLSKDYIGGVYFIKKTEEAVKKINSSFDLSESVWRYDLLLKLFNNTMKIHHVQDVLWSVPLVGDDDNKHDEAINVALRHVNKYVHKADVINDGCGTSKIQWKLDVSPKVSIIIPTTGRTDLLVPCITSIIDNTEYPNYELIFLDNGRGKYPEGIDFLREKRVKVIERDEAFNWSRLNNVGVRESDGELLLFLNDDIEVISENWLTELVRHAVRPEVGCVGGLLLYPDGRIQHAGVFLVDHGGGARHWLHFSNPDQPVYQNIHKHVREVTSNTGACLMVRRDIFEEINGFDEELAVVGNDIDLCLRVSKKGYQNLWTPECRLIHHESISRKEISFTDDERKMWDRWGDVYLSGDPYYNPNLSLGSSDCELASTKKTSVVAESVADDHVGVNIIGYIKAEMGVGEATRGNARALNVARIPFCIINYETGNPSCMGDNTWDQMIVDKPKYEINILHINADLTPEAVKNLPRDFFVDKYTIGYWAWELPDFPDEWLDSFSYVDEVWVPSVFVKEALEKKSPVPVTVVPHPIEKRNLPYLNCEFFNLPSEAFLFLVMYDVHSVQERKNPKGAIQAFRNAFDHNNVNVGLVIKVNNASEAELDELKQELGEYENIYLIAKRMSRYEVDSLIHCCDSFVSLHRSEGFGLVLAESMALGKAVIATNWSGNVDFMNSDNSMCVDYKLKVLGSDFGPYKAHQYWADPDVEQASMMMAELVTRPGYSKELGLAAKRYIDENLSPDAVGALMKKRIYQIQSILDKKLEKE